MTYIPKPSLHHRSVSRDVSLQYNGSAFEVVVDDSIIATLPICELFDLVSTCIMEHFNSEDLGLRRRARMAWSARSNVQRILENIQSLEVEK